jgi:hypothetical protein|tara:strand:- start:907 stop:1896 length:990 start_codon:yes stop_codon:yes gene_type:complete
MNMKSCKLVSVVILNWNGEKYIHECISSVIDQTYSNIEIIIVDNDSSDGSFQKIQKNYPALVYEKNIANLGYAEGVNIGIAKSKGDFVMLLGYDVYLSETYIEKAITKIDTNTKIGVIAGPEFAWADGIKSDVHLASSGSYYLKKRLQVGISEDKDTEQISFGVTGSFPIIRKALFDDLYNVSGHYFDKAFETGWEDTDFRFRAILRGWKTLYFPEIHAWHVGSASDNENTRLIDKSIDYQKRIFRNRLYVIEKNLPQNVKKEIGIYLKITNILMYFYYLIKSPKSLKAIKNAKIEFNNNIKKVIIKRNNILENVIISDEELLGYFKKY